MNQLISLTQQRNTLANQLIALLEHAAFDNQSITQRQAHPLEDQAKSLLAQAHTLAST
jgi:hypothetical protein